MKNIPLAILLLACALLAGGRALADDEVHGDALGISPLFQRGRVEISAGGGYGLASDNMSYLILALGGGYYVRDGLSAGLESEAWLGSQPNIFDVSPYVRFVFLNSSWRYKPYAGLFYRRTFYNHLYSPLDSVGGRAGVVFPLSRRAYATAGAAYEHYFACSTSVNSNCDSFYPELGLEFSF
jgi:hypothetical protein